MSEQKRKEIAELARRLTEAIDTDEFRRNIGAHNTELLLQATKVLAAQADKNLRQCK